MVIRVPPEKRHMRGGAVRHEANKAKNDRLFKGKWFEIMHTIEVKPGVPLRSSLGVYLRKGFLIRDIHEGTVYFVGEATIRMMRKTYGNIVNPIPHKRPGRPLGRKNNKTLDRELKNYLGHVTYKEDLFGD